MSKEVEALAELVSKTTAAAYMQDALEKQAPLHTKTDEILANTATLPVTVARAFKSLEAASKKKAERVETAAATALNKFSGEPQTAVEDNATWMVAELKSRLDSNRKLMEDYHKIPIGALAETNANRIANKQASPASARIAWKRTRRSWTDCSKSSPRLHEGCDRRGQDCSGRTADGSRGSERTGG